MTPKKIPTRDVPRDHYGSRLKNALERLAAMEQILAGGHQDPALVLAVQAVIAASDALTIYHLGERSAAGDHQDAISVFSRIPQVPDIDQARTHLNRVLDHKSEIEYSGKALRKKELESIVDHARRFVNFARKHLPPPS
jgi:hypothetical protein